MRDLAQYYTTDEFLPITWYIGGEYYIGAAATRWAFYNFSATPSAVFDGTEMVIGGQEGGSMFETYAPIVASRLSASSPLSITASYELLGPDWTTGSLDVHIEVVEALPPGSYMVHFVLTEIGVDNKPYLARDALADGTFSLTSIGESVDIQRIFSLDPEWVPENLRPVVFVQSHSYPRAVLQAALAEPAYAATVFVDVEPDGLGAAWTLDGPNSYQKSGTDDATIPVWEAGSFTLTWQPVNGWTSPALNPDEQSVEFGASITFLGQYTDPPFVAVTDGLLGDTGPGRSVCLIDEDGDGDLDIYVVNYGAPNLLLRNDGGLNFTDVASGAVADAGPTTAATWGDFDSDGDPDVYLVKDGEANVLLRNDGDGNFGVPNAFGVDDAGAGRAAAWGDLDGDGQLDLYVVNEGGANKLLRNYGDMGGFFFFAEVSGPVANADDGSSAMWCDYDRDGDQDIYLTNKFAANKLLQNNGTVGWFDATSGGTLGDTGNGAGVAWGDYDNDGWLDLYFTNDGGADKLLKNGASSFVLVPGSLLGNLGHGRGVVWGDFDNDADLDLYVTRNNEADLYLRNDGANVFSAVPLALPVTAGPGCGSAAGDLDGDGDLDVYVVSDGAANVLLLNEKGQDGHWLKVRLEDAAGNVTPAGARVRCVGAYRNQVRELTCGNGYRSQDSPELEFGLWWASVVDTLRITWPSGMVQTLRNLPTEQVVYVRESDISAVGDGGSAPAAFRLHPCRPNPFNPRTTIAYELPADGPVSLRIYDVAGRLVRVLRQAASEAAGRHEAVWDGQDAQGRGVASGTYLCRLESGRHRAVQRLVLVR
jgi:hypothetical protein